MWTSSSHSWLSCRHPGFQSRPRRFESLPYSTPARLPRVSALTCAFAGPLEHSIDPGGVVERGFAPARGNQPTAVMRRTGEEPHPDSSRTVSAPPNQPRSGPTQRDTADISLYVARNGSVTWPTDEGSLAA
jgi:hypothetical protein